MIQGSASQFIAKSQYGALVVGPSHANILEYGWSRLADYHLVFQAFFSILFLKLCTHSYSCGILFLTRSPIFLKEPSDGSGFIALQYMVDGSWKIKSFGEKSKEEEERKKRCSGTARSAVVPDLPFVHSLLHPHVIKTTGSNNIGREM